MQLSGTPQVIESDAWLTVPAPTNTSASATGHPDQLVAHEVFQPGDLQNEVSTTFAPRHTTHRLSLV